MKRDWQPGDVAMIHTRFGRVIEAKRWKDGWLWGNSWTADEDVLIVSPIESARPLVVIDPENREQVDRLGHALYGAGFTATGRLADALRSLIEPPRPPEPLGLGAVVENADGERWVRNNPRGANPWSPESSAARGLSFPYCAYADIAAVRVLSEGVTS